MVNMSYRKCSVPGCNKHAKYCLCSNPLCRRHYKNWQKRGDVNKDFIERTSNEINIVDSHIEIKLYDAQGNSKAEVAYADLEDLDMIKNERWCGSSYSYIRNSRTGLQMHRFVTNCPDGFVVDHLNHNRTDNRKTNLRICTESQNLANYPSDNDYILIGIFKVYDYYKVQVFSKLNMDHRVTLATYLPLDKAVELYNKININDYSHLLNNKFESNINEFIDFDLNSWQLFDDVDNESIDYDNLPDII